MRYLATCIIFCFLGFCSAKRDAKAYDTHKSVVQYPQWKALFSLKTKDNVAIGDVFAKKINDSIFTNLLVVHNRDTVYRIDSTIFLNPIGKDIQAGKKGFYGYKIVLIKADYFVVNCLTNLGANVSDDVTIEWNYQKGMLEVQKVP
jgi:hypothetical protein